VAVVLVSICTASKRLLKFGDAVGELVTLLQ
jgi:hypothetical protein